jgi:hypothetical protein
VPGRWAEPYREAVVDLVGRVPAKAGFDDRTLTRAEKAVGVTLPPALRDFYLAVGRVPLARAHDELLSPDDWFIDGGRLVFMVENQAVVYWGISTAARSGDPPTFQGVNLEPDPTEWHPECRRCSDFLCVMLCWQAVSGGYRWLGVANAPRTIGRHLGKQMTRVGSVHELTAYRRDGTAACLLADAGRLHFGGRTKRHFEAIAGELADAGLAYDSI